MELIEFDCKNCGYKTHLLTGTNTPDQTLSDLNEDFAHFKVYLCPEGKELYSFDHHDREFDQKCPIHHEELQEQNEIPGYCPKCGGNTQTTEKPQIPIKKGG